MAPFDDAGPDDTQLGASGELTLIVEAGSSPPPAPRARLVRVILISSAVLALLVAAALSLLALQTQVEDLAVVGFEWRRAIEVEARQSVREERHEIERWRTDRTERAQGTDQIPRWPPVRLLAGEREGRRSETYLVLLRGRRVYIMELPKQRWSALREGERRRARIQGGRVVELG